MKRHVLTALLAALSLTTSVVADDAVKAKPVEKDKKIRAVNRKERQQDRVAEGMKDGSLTAKETAKIEAKQAKLNEQIREDRQDGKGLTPKEKAKIEAKQDRLSKQIYKEKHDKQKQ
jgi:hypothetical protein